MSSVADLIEFVQTATGLDSGSFKLTAWGKTMEPYRRVQEFADGGILKVRCVPLMRGGGKRGRADDAAIIVVKFECSDDDPVALQAAAGIVKIDLEQWLQSMDVETLTKLDHHYQQLRLHHNVDWHVGRLCEYMPLFNQVKERRWTAKGFCGRPQWGFAVVRNGALRSSAVGLCGGPQWGFAVDRKRVMRC